MSADLENETYLKTQQVCERYGDCSAMWLERRMSDSGFPAPVRLGGALRFWRLSELAAWDAEQIQGKPTKRHDISAAHTPKARAKAQRARAAS